MTKCQECKEIKDYAAALDLEPAPEVDPRGNEVTRWSGMIAPWEVATGDRRTFAQDSLEHRPLPLSLKWQRTDNGGHTTSIVIGTIDGIEYREDGAYAWGIILDPDPALMPRLKEDVEEAKLLLEKGTISPSVDLAAMEAEALDPTGQYAATGQRPDVRVMSGEIGAVTLVPVAAFKEVRPFVLDKLDADEYYALVASARASVPVRRAWDDVPVAYVPWDAASWLADELDGEAMTASALVNDSAPLFPVGTFINGELHLVPGAVADCVSVVAEYGDRLPFDAETFGVMRETLEALADRCDLPAPPWVVADESASLTASAALLKPPDEWFALPEPAEFTPLTVTEDGQVYGHIADWSTCHIGFPGQCRTAPRSASGYAYAHNGSVITASGAQVRVGKLTIGGGHADLKYGARAAQEHYDDVATCAAQGTFRDGKVGIWFSGAAVPEATELQLAQLRRCPPSGDWRRINGSPELILAHAVNTGGFPAPAIRHHDGQVQALVAAGAHYPDEPMDDVGTAVSVFAAATQRAGVAAAAAVFAK